MANMNGIDLNNYYNSYNNYNSYNSSSYGNSSTVGNYANSSPYGVNKAATNSETKSFLSDVKKASNELSNLALNMANSYPPAFKIMMAESSNKDAVSVTTDSGKMTSTEPGTSKVDVDQIAKTQVNTGAQMVSAEKTNQASGFNHFTIEKDGKGFGFTVNVSATDTNQQVQQKTAEEINKRNIGVTAKVVVDEATKKSSLVLESKETGEKNSFVVKDRENSSLMSNLGATTATQTAQDAKYRVNGGETKSSASNDIQLAPGVTATLKKETNGNSANVTFKKDVDGISKQVTKLVDSFNNLLNTANSYKSSGGSKIATQLSNLSEANSNSLSKIGITKKSDGSLEIDKKKLTEAIENGSAEKFFAKSDTGSGFLDKLKTTASTVSNNPSKYLETSFDRVNNTFSNNASNRFNAKSNVNSDFVLAARMSFLESKYSGIGLLFDASM